MCMKALSQIKKIIIIMSPFQPILFIYLSLKLFIPLECDIFENNGNMNMLKILITKGIKEAIKIQ